MLSIHSRNVCFGAVLLGLVGCGDDDGGGDGGGGGFETEAAAVTGIYAIDGHTENLDACDVGGDDLAGPQADGFALALQGDLFGVPFLELSSCASVADCRDALAARDDGQFLPTDFVYTLSGVDGAAFVGTTVTTGFGIGGTCEGAEVQENLLTVDGANLELRQERTVADDYPADGDGFCTTEAAQQAAAGNSCSRLNLLQATFVEAL